MRCIMDKWISEIIQNCDKDLAKAQDLLEKPDVKLNGEAIKEINDLLEKMNEIMNLIISSN